ncbi:MAG: methylphosphotriester-DNA--protein-cysteine methyltransferase family protein [Planctomycetes bacterium]|nr:methylphosphotriester-DNA--protein-cysteine methyltransferase family protein [Planctomycetota bacterium]MCB9935534.1 methylphosphotriester-DNA--protein-cysteine methyltransferase family protein [Planctomycetota bacterium]
MALDFDNCYRALAARDRRFDGRFFVGVKSTRIYCRPVCPARTPRRDRCSFYATAAEAEAAGFVPCLRCRPELAPGHASVDAKAQLAKRAAVMLEKNAGLRIETLAARLGVTARHLRRALRDELGVTPTQLRQRSRIAKAKQLLQKTKLPLTRIAYDSGFASLRRFNAAFRQLEGRAPSALRKAQ